MGVGSQMMRQVDAARRRFGEDSGLIYDESSMSASSNHLQWQYKCKGSYKRIRLCHVGQMGASPLKKILIRKICQHVTDLEPMLFEGIDWLVVKALWDYLSSRDLVSPHVWKAFALSYPNEPCLKHYKTNAHMLMAPGGWNTSLQFVNSPTFKFLTMLEISSTRMTRLDLLSLPEVQNLGVLKVGPAIQLIASDNSIQDGVDDAIIRSWSRSASERGELSCLRTLCMREQNALTADCLSFVSEIHSLAKFTIEGIADVCVDPDTAGLLGWDLKHAGGAEEILQSARATSSKESEWKPEYDDFVSGSLTHAKQIGELEAAALNNVPMIHLRLAGPDMHAWRRSSSIERFCFTRVHCSETITQERLPNESKKRNAVGVPNVRAVRSRTREVASSLAEFGL